MYASEKYGKTDLNKYKELVERSCELKYASGCDSAWRINFKLNSDSGDLNARNYFDLSVNYEDGIVPSCGNGWAPYCVKLADIYISKSVGKTISRQLKLYDSACQEKSEEACEKARKLRNPEIAKPG